MTDGKHDEQLIERYLDGVASPAESAVLQRLLVDCPQAADAFALASWTDAFLEEHFTDRRNITGVEKVLGALAQPIAREGLRGRRDVPVALAEQEREFATVLPFSDHQSSFRRSMLRGIVAAVVILAAGLVLFHQLGSPDAAAAAVETGRVLVDGVEGRKIRDGDQLEVVGDEAAVLRLWDGSRAELVPESKAVIRRRTQRGSRVLELSQGGGEFQIQEAASQFRVETPVGKVTALGTEFAVALRPADRDGETGFREKMAASLIVAVLAGNVEVHYDNHRYALGLGENRVYTGGKQAASEKPACVGRVTAVAAEAKGITLEIPGQSKSEKPAKREIRLTERTRLSFVNVPLHGEKPAVGYRASVWLAEGEPETASAVTFRGQKAAAPPANLAGRVTAVSAGGKLLTLQLPAKKKGEAAPTATICITDATKLTYALVPFDGEKPTAGYNATVWLAPGTKEVAARIAFNGKKVNPPAPDYTGLVTAVSAAGKEITLQVRPKKKGDPATTVTVRVGAKTKVIYAGVGKDLQHPTVGFTATIWLQKGSRELAAGIKFTPASSKQVAAK